jgi:protoporphyrinogen oxidase/glycosyltransferase involved in cell wall biosynthesis
MDSLIVFSHLRWDFAHQRPQHLLSRLARHWRILYVEEPVFDAGDPWAELRAPLTGVTVLRPHTPLTAPGFHDDQIPLLSKLVGQAVEREKLGRYGAWLYTPMALPLLQKLDAHVLVYDCMDELSGSRHAPRQAMQRENALLRMANVVFAAGPGLYEARRSRHPSVHLFPDSVDRAHFARARDEALTLPEVRAMPRPRLGYIGVIDGRIDLALLRDVATLRPEWQLCMAGPVAGIDPAALPRLPNLHWLGARDYDALPGLLAGWDACMLPFAHNDATRYLNPAATLECMAAGKPVASTSVADVRALHGAAVCFADTADAFVAAVDALLVEPAAQREARAATMQRLVAATSWDDTAERMRVLVARASEHGPTEAASRMYEAAATRAPRAAAPRPVQPAGPSAPAPCVIVGAGPAGLSAAYHFGDGALLLEREATVGGWCRSIEDTGFTFDYAGHIMFSNDPYVQELYRLLLGDNVHWQDREAWIYSNGVYARYPFQGSLHGLPREGPKERLAGAVQTRLGSLRDAAPLAANHDALHRRGEGTDPAAGVPCASDAQAADDFEAFIHRTWDAGVARRFAIPYNRKLWAMPLTEMETSWLGGRLPLPDLEDMIEGALMPSRKPMGHDARFGYPLRGGFQALVNGFLPLLRGELHTRAHVERVSPLLRTVTLRDGRRFRYDTLVSTMPLPQLVAAMGEEAPLEIRRAASELRHVSVRCVNLGVGRPHLTDKHWIYYPGDPVFHRVFVQGNASPHCNPPGGFGLTCEITYSPGKPLPATGRALIDRCIADCIRVGLVNASDPILTANQLDLPYAYVVYDHGCAARVAQIREWLLQFEIVLAGRYGEWECYNSDHAFLAGRRAAETARALAASRVAAKTA